MLTGAARGFLLGCCKRRQVVVERRFLRFLRRRLRCLPRNTHSADAVVSPCACTKLLGEVAHASPR
jgi:hypothetical protein